MTAIADRATCLTCAAVPVLILLAGLSPTLQARERQSAPSIPELPARVELELDVEPEDDLLLSRIGACCYTRALSGEPPAFLRKVPPAEGVERLFTVIELAESRVVLSFEILPDDHPSGRRLLIRADLDQDLDLTNDPVHAGNLDVPFGPFRVTVQDEDGFHPYALSLRYFAVSDVDVLWYWRAGALIGSLGGRKIALIDDDTNGRYDDPADVVVADLNGDGSLDGGHGGRERMRRHQPIPWGDGFLAIREVNPVAGSMTVDRAPEIDSVHTVLDAATGNRIPDARITFHPGGLSAVSDARGRAELSRPAGEPAFLRTIAAGYWSNVYGPGQRAGTEVGTVRLAPGPCMPDRMRWCGRETLEASSTEGCQVDLDSGVVRFEDQPTPGPIDVGWYVPPTGLLLQAAPGAAFAFLGATDFDSLGEEDLRGLAFDETEVPAGAACGGKASEDAEVLLGDGTVLGVRTAEGRLGKIRIDSCDRKLDLSWVVYDEPEPER